MKLSMYLLGQISADPQTFKWRENIEEYVEQQTPDLREAIEIINPCRNRFSYSVLDQSNGKEKAFTDIVLKERSTILFPVIDRTFVRKSDVGICNLNHYTPTRPFIGTMFELAWYFDSPGKSVIGIFDGDPSKDYNCSHPFVWRTVQTWVKNEYEAMDVVLNLCVRI